MLIAKQTDNTIIVADYRAMFPEASFTDAGPNGDFLAENNCYPVTMWKPFDRETEKLVTCDPYLEGGTVFTVRVEALTQEELDAAAEKKAADVLAAAKAARQVEVDAIIVTTASGRKFDGNEDAQNRMSRAVNAMDEADTLPWVLADNTIAEVTRAELREALKLAGAAMATIWVRPYL